jgi:hypothetical protein
MAGTRRLSVFHRRIELGLSATALELVFAAPTVRSEGGLDGDRYAGSTAITIDLGSLATQISDLPDASTARTIAELAVDDPRVRHRARRIAFDEAQRLAGGHLLQPEIDLHVRSQGAIVRFALDVEATLRRNS